MMGQETEDKGLIKPYLLGEEDLPERERLEARLLTDDGFFEELLIAEDELVDAFLSGALTQREREQFNNYFLSTPERHQKLRFAAALQKYVADAAASASTVLVAEASKPPARRGSILSNLTGAWWRRPAWSFGLVAAALLLMVLGGVLLTGVWRDGRQRDAGEGRRAMLENRDRDARENQSATGSSEAVEQSRPPFLLVTLAPGVVRDAGEIKRVVVPANVNTVQLRLEIADGVYQNYRAALVSDEGREIFTREQIQPEPAATTTIKTVVVNLPATLLKRGDYQLKLGGLTAGGEIENAGRYSFRVAGE